MATTIVFHRQDRSCYPPTLELAQYILSGWMLLTYLICLCLQAVFGEGNGGSEANCSESFISRFKHKCSKHSVLWSLKYAHPSLGTLPTSCLGAGVEHRTALFHKCNEVLGLWEGKWKRASGRDTPGVASWYNVLLWAKQHPSNSFTALVQVLFLFIYVFVYEYVQKYLCVDICVSLSTEALSVINKKELSSKAENPTVSTSSDFMRQRRFVHYQRDWNRQKVELQDFQDNAGNCCV